jgi:hypothetical protein|tara:strand:- start:134 stop:463 length:330 start_codon:yes stop_codon:yes gene_type:complete
MTKEIEFRFSKRYELVENLLNTDAIECELMIVVGQVVQIQASDLYQTKAYSLVRIKPDSFTKDSYIVQEPDNDQDTYYKRTLKYGNLEGLMIPHEAVIQFTRILKQREP